MAAGQLSTDFCNKIDSKRTRVERGRGTRQDLRTSRMPNTGHCDAFVPVHCATVFASNFSSLRRSAIFVRISSR